MADRKFWLKMPPEFFKSVSMKKLRVFGAEHSVIYLKMLLAAMPSGYFEYGGIGESIEEEIAFEIDEDTDMVRLTLMDLEKYKLMEIIDGKYYFSQLKELVVSEGASAERVRKHRLKKKDLVEDEVLHRNIEVTPSNDEVTPCNSDGTKDKRKRMFVVVENAELDDSLKDLLKEWLEYKNWDFSKTSLSSLVKLFKDNSSTYGLEKVSWVVRLSISSGWKGIYWERLEKADVGATKGKKESKKDATDYSGSFF